MPKLAKPQAVPTSPFAELQMQRLGKVLISSLVVVMVAAGAAVVGVNWGRSVGTVALTGALGMAAGALLGFLFGLPKTTARAAGGGAGGGASASQTVPANTSANASAGPSSRLLNTNTNLEELSDWLTKIIVGLGLVQLGKANDYLVSFESAVAAANKGGNPLVPLSAALTLCACAIIGFLWMYMEARTVLSRVFDWIEHSLNDSLTSALAQISSAGSVSDAAMGQAADSLKTAVELKPDDPRLRTAAVRALTASGRTGEAASILERAQSTTVDDQISKMLVALYKQPGGYDEVLSIASTLSGSAATGRADYWFYVASAFGQKLSVLLKQHPQPESEIDVIRTKIYDAAQKSVAIDTTYRDRLYALAHPKTGSTENDLVDVANDQPFVALVNPTSR